MILAFGWREHGRLFWRSRYARPWTVKAIVPGDVVPRETRPVIRNQVPVSTSITVPVHVKNWVGPFFALQVKDTYEEITQKKPHRDLPH